MVLHIELQGSLVTVLFIGLATAVSNIQSQDLPSQPHSFSVETPSRTTTANRLAKPLIGEDGRIYICSQKNFFSFEKNGSIAWKVTLNYACNANISPVLGGSRKIYLVAENRVLRVNPSNISSVEVFFGPEAGEIIGLAVSISSSCVIINVKKWGLFAYRSHGRLLWSAGPVLYRHGYRQGCEKNVTDCYFSSVPVIDHCEAAIYISNNKGELYSLSIRNPHFKWIRDLSSFDKKYIVTPANNDMLYVTLPTLALLLALDVSTGNILWQRRTGPLSSEDYAPAVQSNGWISIGSLDGSLYSFSPSGVLKKFQRFADPKSVILVNPVLDCSGFGVYISQTQMEGKVVYISGDYNFVSALKPKSILFMLLVPATGSIYWSESYPPGQYVSNLSQSDLQYFKLDETVLLHFLAASSHETTGPSVEKSNQSTKDRLGKGSPLPCRSTRQKFAYSCSQTISKNISPPRGDEKITLLLLLTESTLMIILAALVCYCRIFWMKTKLQSQGLGKFLEKRQSLRLQKKAFDRTISELEQKATEEEELDKLGKYVREREGIERKLSTTYSLGRDGAGLKPKSLLPLYDGKTRSYSFQGAKRENVTIFHTLSNTDRDTSSSYESSSEYEDKDFQENNETNPRANKGKAPVEVWSCSSSEDEEETFENKYRASPSNSASSSRGVMSPLSLEHQLDEREKGIRNDDGLRKENMLLRRRTLSSTN